MKIIGNCLIKVKVKAGLWKFSPFTAIQNVLYFSFGTWLEVVINMCSSDNIQFMNILTIHDFMNCY